MEGCRQNQKSGRRRPAADGRSRQGYKNAVANSDKANAKLEHDKALSNAVMSLMADHIELFKQFSDNPGFKTWLTDASFRATYHPPAGP
ncbi:hypothetical protein [Stenotrophomonas acidaminiphila]|uniref:hypothetical protein n=1 Tax=Stenotrophomonas acidaminiphila TaxID=128780 RepID=UPI0039BCE1B0